MRNYIIGGLVLLAVGIGIGRYLTPEKIVEVEKTTESTETEKEVLEQERTNPDGTTERVRIVREVKKETITNEVMKLIESNKSMWSATALAGYTFKDKEIVYGLGVDRRVLGNIHVGAFGLPSKELYGLTVRYEF